MIAKGIEAKLGPIAAKLSTALGKDGVFVLVVCLREGSTAVLADMPPDAAMEALFEGVEYLQAHGIGIAEAIKKRRDGHE